VPKERALDVLRALLDAWREDLTYRVSRVKSRMKFMVDDYGPEGVRAAIEDRLGRRLEDFALGPPPEGFSDHVGVHPQKQPGLVYLGVPIHLGLVSGEQMTAVADLVERLGGDVRITRLQNLVLANVPEERVDDAVEDLRGLGFPLDLNRVRAASLACTGEPHCNFSVTETKTRADALIRALERRFGDDVAGLRLHLDGCPHACAQHWVGDLGFQGTTARDEGGVRRQAYDIFVRGGLGSGAEIGRPLFRRVPTDDLDDAVAGLVAGWLSGRNEGEQFVDFSRRLGDDELGTLAGLEPARARERAEAA
jgi:ferredoxin-nitrite reductase